MEQDGRFSALQRAEIAEIPRPTATPALSRSFSALQRAEIAEIPLRFSYPLRHPHVSVLFNEPKLLKSRDNRDVAAVYTVSVLFNEPKLLK